MTTAPSSRAAATSLVDATVKKKWIADAKPLRRGRARSSASASSRGRLDGSDLKADVRGGGPRRQTAPRKQGPPRRRQVQHVRPQAPPPNTAPRAAPSTARPTASV